MSLLTAYEQYLDREEERDHYEERLKELKPSIVAASLALRRQIQSSLSSPEEFERKLAEHLAFQFRVSAQNTGEASQSALERAA